MQDTFVAGALAAYVGLGALLLGVFGFLFTIYAAAVIDTGAKGELAELPQIVGYVRDLCRWISWLLLFNSICTIASVGYFIWGWRQLFSWDLPVVLGIALCLLVIALAIVCFRISHSNIMRLPVKSRQNR